MAKVNDVYEFLKTIAPEEMAAETDNVGFLVGSGGADVSAILVSLDITDEVITEALDIGAELIVAHHPLFFSLESVTDTNITGKKVVRMLAGGVSAICMHTNLDAAHGGVNDALAVTVGIADKNRDAEPLSENKRLTTGEVVSLGRVGYLKNPCSMREYLDTLKKALNTNGLRYYDSGRDVHRIAISAGSGGAEWDNAIKSGCDTFITADIKYHMFLAAKELGINIIDGGHFCTENLVVDVLAEKLGAAFPAAQIIVSMVHKQTVDFY